MTACPGSALVIRQATVFAASATIVVAVGSDVVAGGHPWHTAALGAVAAVLAVLRLRIAGEHNGLFAAISAALLIQPVLHAATSLSPSNAATVTVGPGHAATEASATVLHVLVAALIVAVVAGSEHLFLLVAALAPFTRWLGILLWRPVRLQPPASPPPSPAAPARRWLFTADIARRGPPTARRATAT